MTPYLHIESKLYDMKHIAERVVSDEIFIFESQKQQFLKLKKEVAELENQLRIFYN